MNLFKSCLPTRSNPWGVQSKFGCSWHTSKASFKGIAIPNGYVSRIVLVTPSSDINPTIAEGPYCEDTRTSNSFKIQYVLGSLTRQLCLFLQPIERMTNMEQYYL